MPPTMGQKQRADTRMVPDTPVQRWHAIYWTVVVGGAFVPALLIIAVLDAATV